MRNKYKAVPVFYSSLLNRQLMQYEVQEWQQGSKYYGGVTKFDSQLEFKTYQVLKSSYLVSDVIPHYGLNILSPNKKSKCYPNGKKWKVDFLAKDHLKNPLMIVEAKGLVTKEFPLILALLEQNNLEMFKKLWLVFDSIPSSNLIKALQKNDYPKIVTLSQFKKLIT